MWRAGDSQVELQSNLAVGETPVDLIDGHLCLEQQVERQAAVLSQSRGGVQHQHIDLAAVIWRILAPGAIGRVRTAVDMACPDGGRDVLAICSGAVRQAAARVGALHGWVWPFRCPERGRGILADEEFPESDETRGA